MSKANALKRMANQHKNNIKELENAISLVKDKKKNLDD